MHAPGFHVVRSEPPVEPSPPAPPAFRVYRPTRAERRLARLGRSTKGAGTPGGRPSRFSDAWASDFLDLLRQGNFRSTAARATGLGVRTIKWWCQCGHAGVPPFADFLVAVETAEAEFEVQAVRYITRAMITNPGLTLAVLRARFPQRFSPRAGLPVAAEDAEPEAERGW